MDLRKKTAAEMVQDDRKEMITGSRMRWLTLIVYVVLLILVAKKINIGFVLGSLVIFLLGLRSEADLELARGIVRAWSRGGVGREAFREYQIC